MSVSLPSMATAKCRALRLRPTRRSPRATKMGPCTGAAGLFPRLHCQRRQYAGLRRASNRGQSPLALGLVRRRSCASNANELTHHSLLCRGQRRRALSLHGSTIISLPLGPGRNEFGPAVVRVRTAKSAVAGDHFLHAHFVGWQTAIVRIVRKEIALTSARAPRHLSGLADAKVEQHCHCYGHYDEHQSHGSPPARCRAPIPGYGTIILAHMIRKKPCAEQFLELRRVTHRSI